MSDRTDALVQALFNKPSLQECSLQQVDYLAHQYPYFSTAQVLLLQKADKASEAYTNQLQEAALHFSNPLLLDYLLDPARFETEMPEPELYEIVLPETAPEIEEGKEEESKSFLPDVPTAPEPIAEAALPTVILPEVTTGATAIASTEESEQTQKAPLTFEPFHTVDYFASQGIRLSQQETSGDALGKQMKSFTDWLKTMKRLPEKTIEQSTDTAGERKVENLAAHSLDAAEVVTESMAEVWQKQGKWEKAVDVYRKLSLQNPSKSAYFAAKIQSLKKD